MSAALATKQIVEKIPFFERFCKRFPVFPVRNKLPLVTDWKNQATKDPDQIKKWVKTFGKNIDFAMPTGQKSGVWVVDVDNKKGKNGTKALSENLKPLPQTVCQTTPSNGMHYLFNYDELRPISCRTDIFGKKSGVDIRGDGGYIVIAFSDGYSFLPGAKLPGGLAEAPEELYDFLIAKKKKAKSGEANVIEEEEMKEILSHLDPADEQFETRDGWQEIMRACHSGSGGEDWGKQLFTDWSLRHPGPWEKDVEAEISRDWDSYTPGGGQTVATLYHYIKETGVVLSTPPEDTMDVKHSSTDGKLQLAPKGRMKSNVFNVITLFDYPTIHEKDNPLYKLFCYNELTDESCFFKAPPWDKSIKAGRPVCDRSITFLIQYISGVYKVDMPKEIVRDGVEASARKNKTHPVRNYLNSLKWDGEKRLNSWLPNICRIQADEYTKAVSEKLILSLIARVMNPGCQMDTMVVFEGAQGAKKSTLCRVLGHDGVEGRGWYSAPALNISGMGSGDTSVITDCLGSWVIEMEEMSSVRKADEKQIKKFLSTMSDKGTLKYDKYATRHPRQFVCIGTINPYGEGRYIRDPTGARRFWPIRCRGSEDDPMDISWLKKNIDQIYAEGVELYKKGGKVFLEGAALTAAKAHQDARIMGRGEALDIEEYFEQGSGSDMTRVHTTDVCKDIFKTNVVKQFMRDEVMEYLKSHGWEYKKTIRVNGRVAAGFKLKPSHIRNDELE